MKKERKGEKNKNDLSSKENDLEQKNEKVDVESGGERSIASPIPSEGGKKFGDESYYQPKANEPIFVDHSDNGSVLLSGVDDHLESANSSSANSTNDNAKRAMLGDSKSLRSDTDSSGISFGCENGYHLQRSVCLSPKNSKNLSQSLSNGSTCSASSQSDVSLSSLERLRNDDSIKHPEDSQSSETAPRQKAKRSHSRGKSKSNERKVKKSHSKSNTGNHSEGRHHREHDSRQFHSKSAKSVASSSHNHSSVREKRTTSPKSQRLDDNLLKQFTDPYGSGSGLGGKAKVHKKSKSGLLFDYVNQSNSSSLLHVMAPRTHQGSCISRTSFSSSGASEESGSPSGCYTARGGSRGANVKRQASETGSSFARVKYPDTEQHSTSAQSDMSLDCGNISDFSSASDVGSVSSD